MSECKKRSASKAAKELIRDAVHQEMRENGRIKRAHRNKKKKTTKNVSRIIGGNGKHGFGKGNRLRDGKQVGKTTFVPSSLKPTPKKIKTVFPGLGRRIDGHDSPLHVEKEDYGRLEKMTDRFSCAILFDIMKKGKKSKVDEYFQEHLMGEVQSVRGISRATATNAGEFKIIKLKGGGILAGGHVLGKKNDYVGNADDHNDSPNGAGEGGEQAFIRYHEQGSTVWYEEVVDIMPLDDAKQCIEMMYAFGDYGKAKLKPICLGMIPSLFWSLVIHCLHGENTTVEQILLSLFPDYDWKLLTSKGRFRTPSLKCLENRKQAMRQDDWTLFVDWNVDINGLTNCMKKNSTTDNINSWVNILVEMHVPNHNVLANFTPDEIHHILKMVGKKGSVPTKKVIKEWIEEARMITMQELTYRFIGFNADAYGRLVNLGLCPPKKLSCFASEPEKVLHAMYGEDGIDSPTDKPNKKAVEKWCKKAKEYLGIFPWLETIEAIGSEAIGSK